MDQRIEQLLSHYFDEPADSLEDVPFGLTNLTQIVTVKQKKYVARIYGTQTKDLDKLTFEIELMSYLSEKNLSFSVPDFLPDRNGRRYIELSNGQLGSVVRFIEGEVPKLHLANDVKEYGKCVGEISAALSPYKGDSATPYLKFHEYATLHSMLDQATVERFVERPPFEWKKEQADIFHNGFQLLQNSASQIDALPKQIVHHDLLIFNLLIGGSERKMTGVLDFDFASLDARAWEPAICIAHLLQHHESAISPFLDEYFAYMSLTDAEAEWIPALVKMYYVSVLCIYIGQFKSGRDVSAPFAYLSERMAEAVRWLDQNGQSLTRMLIAKGGEA